MTFKPSNVASGRLDCALGQKKYNDAVPATRTLADQHLVDQEPILGLTMIHTRRQSDLHECAAIDAETIIVVRAVSHPKRAL